MESQEIVQAIGQLSNHIATMAKSEPQPHRSSELKELFTALAKAQAEMQTAGLSQENPYFKTRYAGLAAIVKASRPALTKNGLSIIQQLLLHDDGHTVLHTLLCHNSGQWIESRMRITPPKNDVQSMGSYITYLRRYSIAALCGIVASDEDDDAEMATNTRDLPTKNGVYQNKYQGSEYTPETISREELAQLETELASHSDIIPMILDGLKIRSLADMPKDKYRAALTRIRTIKAGHSASK